MELERVVDPEVDPRQLERPLVQVLDLERVRLDRHPLGRVAGFGGLEQAVAIDDVHVDVVPVRGLEVDRERHRVVAAIGRLRVWPRLGSTTGPATTGPGVTIGAGVGVTTGARLGAGEAGSSSPDDPRPLKAAAVAKVPPRTRAPRTTTPAVRRRLLLVRKVFIVSRSLSVTAPGHSRCSRHV